VLVDLVQFALEDAGLAEQGALRAADGLGESMRRGFQFFLLGDPGDYLGTLLDPGPDGVQTLRGAADTVFRT